MNIIQVIPVAVAAVFYICGCTPEKEIALVDKGLPKAYVVVQDGASVAMTNAAAALVRWTQEKTGATLPTAASVGAAKGTPVVFEKVDPSDETAGFKYDGFKVEASQKRVTIKAKEEQGFEFAVHYLLNRFGGIDWFHPESGADFEKSDRFAIPVGTLAKTPPKWREGGLAGNPKSDKTMSAQDRKKLVEDWNTRNGFYTTRNHMGGHVIGEWLLWTPVDADDLKRERENITTNWTGIFKSKPGYGPADMYARWKILVKKHPDWFGLVDGKRVATSQELIGNGAYGYLHRTAMPCLSNPEVREQMLKNYLLKRHSDWFANYDKVTFGIICDDQPCWCECDNCMKLIKFKGTQGGDDKAADYYWDFLNWIAPRMLAADPTLTVNAYAYQSHRAFPQKVKPQPQGDRMNLVLCTHGRCYLHELTNTVVCARNKDMVDRARQWSAAGFPVSTFEYHGQIPGRCNYFFWERAWINDLKWYRANNIMHGNGMLLGPWFSWYNKDKYYFDLNNAKSKWFTWWLSAHFYWDPDDDFDAVRDRMLTKYYRSAGKEMTAYHKYLEKKVYDAGLHMDYVDTEEGFHDVFAQVVAGRPGVLKPAQDLLAAAKKAAANDPVALQRIAWDEAYFHEEWEEAAPLYAENWTENHYKSMSPLGPDRYGSWYIMIGSMKWHHECFGKKYHVSFKAKGTATGRIEYIVTGGKEIKIPLDVNSPDEYKLVEYDLDTGNVIAFFRIYETNKLEFKDFTITSVCEEKGVAK